MQIFFPNLEFGSYTLCTLVLVVRTIFKLAVELVICHYNNDNNNIIFCTHMSSIFARVRSSEYRHDYSVVIKNGRGKNKYFNNKKKNNNNTINI